MKHIKKLGAVLSGLSASALPLLVSAQVLPNSPATDVTGIKTLLCGVVAGWMFTFLVVLTVIFVLIAAFKYLTAAGDPEKVKSAGNTLVYAAVAIVIALFAKGLPLIIGTFVGVTFTGC